MSYTVEPICQIETSNRLKRAPADDVLLSSDIYKPAIYQWFLRIWPYRHYQIAVYGVLGSHHRFSLLVIGLVSAVCRLCCYNLQHCSILTPSLFAGWLFVLWHIFQQWPAAGPLAISFDVDTLSELMLGAHTKWTSQSSVMAMSVQKIWRAHIFVCAISFSTIDVGSLASDWW